MKKLKYIAKHILEVLHLSPQYNAGKLILRNEDGPTGKRKNSFQMISLHIPKSGGTSFYQILQGVYGRKKVARVDYKPHLKRLLINERAFNKDTFSDDLKVIHGHINYKILNEKIDLAEDVKLITWIRDPVERVISDYFYVQSMLEERYNADRYNPHILNRITKTLVEFASQPSEQNRISKFLGDIRLEEIYFVGVLEFFEEDLADLASMLKWKSYTKEKLNKTKNKPKDIPADIVEKIRALNKKDVDLYEKVLVIRKNRIK